MAKVSNEQVIKIREEYSKKEKSLKDNEHNPITKVSYRQLADKYGVSHTLIEGIIKGKFRNESNYKIR